MENYCSKAAVVVAVLVLTSCSESPTASATKTEAETKKAAGPAEPVTAKTAFWEMYKLAHSWTADTLVLSMASKSVPGIKNEAGKAAMWTAIFASAGQHKVRTLTYSIVEQPPDIRKGVDVGRPLPWEGPTRQAMPFQTGDFVVDSDVAYQTALGMAGAWVKKNPGKEVSLTLGHASRFPAPVWYVLWGDNKSGYFVLVNATTGKVIGK
jgi:hypothetical protein